MGGKGSKDEKNLSPIEDRKCRDVIFLLAFIVFWGGMIIVAIFGFVKGNPATLLYPTDSNGNLCGFTPGYTNTPNAYFPKPSIPTNAQQIAMAGLQLRFCVASCPTSFPNITEVQADFANAIVCSPDVRPFPTCKLPFQGNDTNVLALATELITGQGTLFQTYASCTEMYNYVNNGSCGIKYPSTAALFRCMPNLNNAVAAANDALRPGTEQLATQLNDATYLLNRYQADVAASWPVLIVTGILAPFVLGFIWLILLKYLAGFMVFLTILVFLGSLAAVTVIFFFKSGRIGTDSFSAVSAQLATVNVNGWLNPTSDYTRVFDICGWIMVAVCGISLLIVLVMIPRIRIAIGIVREASDALRAMPLVIFYPFVTYAMQLILLVYWVVVAIWLFGCQYWSTDTKTYDYDNRTKGAIAYHVFGLFWTTNFIDGFGQCVMAGAFATYYFTRDKKNLPFAPVMRSFSRTWRYHVGSIAFGSLIIAIVQFIRAMLAYLERKSKAAENAVVKFVFRAIQYCLACFERFLKFLTKRAYIVIAIHGYSFCKAAREGMMIVLGNILRVAAVSIIGEYLMFLGKLAISFASCFLCFIWLSKDSMYDPNTGARPVSSPLLPIILVALGAYIISSAFLSIYDMAMDTILFCFCMDQSENNGRDKPYYASSNLIDFLDKSAGKKAAAGEAPNETKH
eukprot:tig00001542_g9324.t1